MKSKVYFDLNGKDESVIVAEITRTTDVRDKVADRFFEALGFDSNLALVRLLPNQSDEKPITRVLEIVSIGDKEGNTAELCRGLCTRQLEMLQDMIPKVLKERVTSGKKSKIITLCRID